MFISTAYAQAGGASGGDNFLVSLAPILLIFVIFWFFLLRPQQKKAKEHREMVQNLKRNDQVVTSGGIIGRVVKIIDDNTVQVEIADNVRVRVVRSTITEIMSRTEPAKSDSKAEKKEETSEGASKPEGAEEGKKSLFSFGPRK